MKTTRRHMVALGLLGSVTLSAGDSAATPDAGQLAQCTRACQSGREAILNFCRSLPDPRMKTPCFALALGSVVACTNWCYFHWGT